MTVTVTGLAWRGLGAGGRFGLLGREGEIISLGVLLLQTRHRLSPVLLTFSSVTKLFQASRSCGRE